MEKRCVTYCLFLQLRTLHPGLYVAVNKSLSMLTHSLTNAILVVAFEGSSNRSYMMYGHSNDSHAIKFIEQRMTWREWLAQPWLGPI